MVEAVWGRGRAAPQCAATASGSAETGGHQRHHYYATIELATHF